MAQHFVHERPGTRYQTIPGVKMESAASAEFAEAIHLLNKLSTKHNVLYTKLRALRGEQFHEPSVLKTIPTRALMLQLAEYHCDQIQLLEQEIHNLETTAVPGIWLDRIKQFAASAKVIPPLPVETYD